ncbi:MAG: EamA family transporter [Candidatus Eiseniibacteriota bacterium]
MTPFTLALVLASAAIHASWNLWTKQIGPGARSTSLIWMLTAFSSVLYAPFALWTLAHGSWHMGAAALPWMLGSGVIHVGYFLLLIAGYRASDLSLVYPLARGSGPLLAATGAVLLLGEPVTPLLIAGGLLIALGVLTLSWGPRPGQPGALAAGVRFGLGVGVTIAIYTLWDGWSVQRVGVPPLVFYWFSEVTRTLLLAPAAWADRAGVARLWRENRARIAGIATLSPLSYILILIAMRHGAVSHIAPAREMSILIGTWLGGRVLGEGGRQRRLIAAGAFAAGVIALAWT